MSIKPKFEKSEDAKKAGWFSRRHQTNEAHLKEHERQINKKKRK